VWNNQFSSLYMTNQPSTFCHKFSHSSPSHSDHVCTRSETTVQTASSQQQHKIFPSTHTLSHLRIAWTYSESLCCCAFRVTPIAVSETDRDSGQNWARPWGSGILSWKKYLQYQIKHQNQCRHHWLEADTDYREQRPYWGLIFPLSCVCLDRCRQCQYFSNYI